MTVIEFYNLLLEAERAGVKALSRLVKEAPNRKLEVLLQAFLYDEGMNCQILTTFLKQKDSPVSDKTGDFAHKMEELSDFNEKLKLLVRGQLWVARKISEHKSLIKTESELMFIEAIRIQHEENVRKIAEF